MLDSLAAKVEEGQKHIKEAIDKKIPPGNTVKAGLGKTATQIKQAKTLILNKLKLFTEHVNTVVTKFNNVTASVLSQPQFFALDVISVFNSSYEISRNFYKNMG